MQLVFTNPFINKSSLVDSSPASRQSSDSTDAASVLCPAEQVLKEVHEWADAHDEIKAVSMRAKMMAVYGYKDYFKQFEGKSDVCIALRIAESACIELASIIAYPEKRGNGSAVLRFLCDTADKFGVTMWLNAYPFGRDREHIPLARLRKLYASFGFFPMKWPRAEWICGYHKWDCVEFKSVMMRNPQDPQPLARPAQLDL